MTKAYKPHFRGLHLERNRATAQSTWRKILLFVGIFFVIPGFCYCFCPHNEIAYT